MTSADKKWIATAHCSTDQERRQVLFAVASVELNASKPIVTLHQFVLAVEQANAVAEFLARAADLLSLAAEDANIDAASRSPPDSGR